MKQLLVTGGAGFIGCNFVRYMLKTYSHINIINVDKLTYAGSLNNLKNLPDKSRHIFVQGDICERPFIDQLLREYDIDTVVNFAAESHVDNSIKNPKLFIETNISGTFTLLESARQFWLEEKQWLKSDCRFHHVSTDEVYGTLSKDEPAFTEATAYAPNSPYSASKAGSDHLVRAYFHTYGLPVTISNCSNNYGPYQHSEKLIPMVIHSCLAEEKIPIYGNGTNIRDWLYVEDHCSAIDKILHNGRLGEVYNIGANNEVDNLTLVKQICQILDKKQPRKNGNSYQELITFVTDRAGHDWRYAIDNRKIKNELNWQPVYSLQGALDLLINEKIQDI
ncbi:dTDP-glucose 4,6-dehydratase 2 [Piscirickettsia salmonis]|uniref:dTDP-glucose 4,6-dehydratase n=1 Tax=Piscirickettsia salmonis TaxID=1238 RepID=UPI0012BB0EF9|nr:dTDP-glucose 4,6-dehydratase [Piscirickettsia salmonis]QGP52728.1 dTDP-glucose 4,6-dehydratase 2 [Piscirickettsia salmonis]QGP57591.1 dTDP-glucose 4,6-dehydratase 2 [Piscirickettsia salmonis]QGP62296.1 dTDP-glucose 4,6-dehydratase 2 [Piscirickettsia salmonis]